MIQNSKEDNSASKCVFYANTGDGLSLIPIDIGVLNQMAVIDPDTAFWCLIKKEKLGEYLCDKKFLESYHKHSQYLQQEIDNLRFHL